MKCIAYSLDSASNPGIYPLTAAFNASRGALKRRVGAPNRAKLVCRYETCRSADAGRLCEHQFGATRRNVLTNKLLFAKLAG